MPDPEDSDEEVEEKATGDPVMSGKEEKEKKKKKKKKYHLCAKAYDPKVPKSTVRKNLPGKYVYNPAPGALLGTGHHSSV